MDSSNVATWIMVGIAGSGGIGAMLGYFIKQNSRLATLETEMRQLRDLVTKNAETVQEMTVTMADTNAKLQIFLEMQKHG